QDGGDPGPGPAGPARHRRQGRGRPRRPVWWPAPAARHRPRPGQRGHPAAGRRADRRARLRGRKRGDRADAAAAPGRPDHHPGHARPGRGRGGRARGADAGRKDRRSRACHRRGRRYRSPLTMDTAVTAQGPARQLLPVLVAAVATVAVAVAGLRVSGLGVIDAIGYALVIIWALAGTVVARAADGAAHRAAYWLIALGALTGAVALTAARLGAQDQGAQSQTAAHHAARVLATLAGPLVIAISFHYLLALPDGRLGQPGRRLMAGLGYASAFGTGIGLAIAGRPFPLTAGAVIWPLAVLCALPATRLRYLKAAGRDKERMQWLGTGLVVAATVALISAVLHLLVGWPESAGAVAASASAAVPLAVILAEWPPLARHGGRVLVHALSTAGSAAVVAVVYLVIVLGLGEAPDSNADRRILGFSIVAAALAAIGYLPIRGRLVAFATRFVYGTREAPGETLRTFGSRMTRAVSM